MKRFLAVFIATAIGCSWSGGLAYSATFSNQFMEITLPEDWGFELVENSWIGESKTGLHNLRIMATADIKGRAKNVQTFHEKHSRPLITGAGRSTVLSAKIHALTPSKPEAVWSDSLHLNSERRGFLTRYLATEESDLIINLKIVYPKEARDDYKGLIEKIVNSIRVFRKPSNCGSVDSSEPEQGLDASLFPIAREPAQDAHSWRFWEWLGSK